MFISFTNQDHCKSLFNLTLNIFSLSSEEELHRGSRVRNQVVWYKPGKLCGFYVFMNFWIRAYKHYGESIRRRVVFTLSAFHLTIPLSLSPLYHSLSLSIPLSPCFSLSIPLNHSLSLPPSLYLSFYLSFSLFPSFSVLFIILFGASNGRFRPCFTVILINTTIANFKRINNLFANYRKSLSY